ncbi:MAG: hypothetical protein JJ921_18355 [Pseudomonadales bacterium]|nr:hypothetical protein [Pseudomonadales bacterium]MBO7005343.1 hypothetical protein [Pseudomonadales bacterium]
MNQANIQNPHNGKDEPLNGVPTLNVEEDGKILRTDTRDDPLAEHLDVMGCNQDPGRHFTKVTDIENARWLSDMNRPVRMGEFGAGAPQGNRGGPHNRWTEDYQVTVYEAQLSMMEDTRCDLRQGRTQTVLGYPVSLLCEKTAKQHQLTNNPWPSSF